VVPLTLLVPSSAALATILHVPGDFATIASAVAAASASDTVEVACGTYLEGGIVVTGGRAVHLRSEDGDPFCVTIDGEGLPARVLSISGASSLILRGVTVRNGFGGNRRGGVFVAEGSTLNMANCRVIGAQDDYGSGVRALNSSLLLSQCEFQGNGATGYGFYGVGGGLYAAASNGTVSDSQFLSNVAVDGGGAYLSGGTLSFERCRFTGNGATGKGGGAHVTISSNTTFTDCVFAYNGVHATFGGAVHGATAFQMDGCTVVSNSAANGGGLFVGIGPTSIHRSVIAFNSSGVACSTPPSVTCTDLFGNGGGDWTGCLAGFEGTSGNFSADPLFCDQAARDYRLSESSPCVAGNHPDGESCGLVGALGKACGAVHVDGEMGRSSWGRIKGTFR
jgi:hypothetical protein